MAFSGKILYKRHPETTLKELKQAVKVELKNVVFDWHDGTLADHFKPSAVSKYKYKARTKKYRKKKHKLKGHGNPLVWSGLLRTQTTRSISVSGTSKKATGRMSAPAYTYMNSSTGINKAAELTAVAQPEIAKMAGTLQERVVKRVDDAKPSQPIIRRF